MRVGSRERDRLRRWVPEEDGQRRGGDLRQEVRVSGHFKHHEVVFAAAVWKTWAEAAKAASESPSSNLALIFPLLPLLLSS